jgi:hypothetical protein
MAALKHAAFNKKQSRQRAVADRACTCRVLVLLPYDNCPPTSEETGKMKQIYTWMCQGYRMQVDVKTNPKNWETFLRGVLSIANL